MILSKKHKSKAGCVIFEKHLQAFIKRAVKKADPACREICGVMVSNGHGLELVQIRNEAKKPLSFAMSFRRLRKVKRAAKKIKHRMVGSFHSHPISGAEPGESDIKGTVDGTLMLIIDCTDKKAKLWRIKKNKALPVPLHRIKT